MGYSCLQTTFCIFNGLIAVLAAACVGVGAWALADKDGFSAKITEALDGMKIDGISAADIQNAAILIVIIGSIILLVAGIGCCGAQKDSKCLLGVFFISMIIMCALVIAVAVVIHFFPGKIQAGMKKEFFKYINDETDEAAKSFVESFQKTFKCCGVEGPNDYNTTTPLAPCKTEKTGCAIKLKEMIQNLQSPFFIVSIVTLILLVLATAISGYLYCNAGGNAV